MSEEERSDLIADLEYRSKRIGNNFQLLVLRTSKALKQANCTVCELKTLFVRDDRIFKALGTTENLDDAIFELSKLSSFFDYELLMNVAQKYCRDQELYEDFVAYSEELKVFCQRRLCEVPIDAFASKNCLKKSYLRIKVDKNWQITLNQVKDLERQISDILKVKLQLLEVKDGCVELFFNPLCTVNNTLSQQQKKQLREIGVIRVHLGEEEYNLTDNQETEKQVQILFRGRSDRAQCKDHHK